MNIGFIGCGNIAYAITAGVIDSGIQYNKINIFDLNQSAYDKYKTLSVCVLGSVEELIYNSDIVFLTVKPQIYPELLNIIADLNINFSSKIFVDVAPGISIKYIKSILGSGTKVVRVMPNTPCLLGCGAAAAVRDDVIDQDDFEYICSLFGACGICIEVNEDQINAVIAVSGSSPAYFFAFVNSIIKHGTELGLPQETAEKLCVQTLLGSAKMLTKTEFSPNDLIKMVASPGGTTQAALENFDKNNFNENIKSAMDAAVNRAEQLEK